MKFWYYGLGLSLILSAFSMIPTEFHGKYLSNNQDDVVSLNLAPDSSYTQSWNSCTVQFVAIGKWTMKFDTIVLKPNSVKEEFGLGQADKITRGQMNKLLARHDTLITLIHKNGEYKTWFPLIRQE